MCGGEKLPSLKLYPSQEDQWSIQWIVIKFLVIILTKKMQTNINNFSANLRFSRRDISKCQLFKTLHSCVFPSPLPFTSEWMMLRGFPPFLVLFFFSSSLLSVILRNSSVLKMLQSSSRKTEGLHSGRPWLFSPSTTPSSPVSHQLPRPTRDNGRQAAVSHPQPQQHLLPPLRTLSAGGQGKLSLGATPVSHHHLHFSPRKRDLEVLWGDSKWPEQFGKSGHLRCSPFPCLQWSVTLQM